MPLSDRLAVLVGTVFFAGHAPVASGTFGSLAGVVLYLLVRKAGWPVYVGVLAGVVLIGTWAADRCEKIFGEKDSSRVVVDEVAGFLVSMAGAPRGWQWVAGGFLVFRFFDIIKPAPAGWVDRRLGGGAGVMLDDLIAGAYTWLTLKGCQVLLSVAGR